MSVTQRGEPYRLWRAVDEHGAELDIPLQTPRDKAAAKRFFRRVRRSSPMPRKIVTDQLRSYPAPTAEIPERHLLRASLYRKQLADRFVAWREFTEPAQNPSNSF